MTLILSLLLSLILPASAEQTQVLRRYTNVNASQGVAVDDRYFYAVSNSTIVKFDKQTGARLIQWRGDPVRYPHINSCTVIDRDLVCASSNYPVTPMRSRVEIFDPETLATKRSIVLDGAPGSVTWIDRRDGHWWVGFANYDGWGGQYGRDHNFTTLVEYDDAWNPLAQWRFPKSVLDRFAPFSNSGGGFGDDGLLYTTGHDRREIYVLRVPKGGGELIHLATLPIDVDGQAIAWDHGRDRVLYGINRGSGDVVAMRLPPVDPDERATP